MITAEDITDLVLENAGYYWQSGYNEFDFTCKIQDQENKIHLIQYRHDEGYGITIHSDKDDIWGKLSVNEIFKLEDKLLDAVQYWEYHRKIEKASDADALYDIKFSLMEDDNPNLTHVIEKLWVEFEGKMNLFGII